MPVESLEFTLAAREYCSLIETAASGNDSRIFARECLTHLLRLYQLALQLPDTTPGNRPERPRSIEHDEWDAIRRAIAERLPDDFYWEIFDSIPVYTSTPDPVVGSFSDDLADIWHDLRPGLDAIDAVPAPAVDPETTLWQWRWTFEYHWGRHAARAIPVLHDLSVAGRVNT